ncbi:uncharacterized protein [Narcine bancroftii]|uniref:uncharacterized protein n=1 Tax=Narcine bancroftii TaxID=1343680 RepID=UPI003831F800
MCTLYNVYDNKRVIIKFALFGKKAINSKGGRVTFHVELRNQQCDSGICSGTVTFINDLDEGWGLWCVEYGSLQTLWIIGKTHRNAAGVLVSIGHDEERRKFSLALHLPIFTQSLHHREDHGRSAGQWRTLVVLISRPLHPSSKGGDKSDGAGQRIIAFDELGTDFKNPIDQCNPIRARERLRNIERICSLLRKLVLPEYSIHGLFCVMFTCAGEWVTLGLNIPLLFYHLWRYFHRPADGSELLYDPASVMSAEILNYYQKESWFKLSFYLISFFYYLYSMVYTLVSF